MYWRRILMSLGREESKDRSTIVAGDILCAKADGSKAVFDAADHGSIPSSWTPIGVVVIPPSHDVYGTGEGAAVSLKNMSPNYPDDGHKDGASLYFGQYYGSTSVDLSLTNFNKVNITNNVSTPTISYGDSGYLPVEVPYSTQCVTDPTTYYHTKICCPSPYLSDGSRNANYYTTAYSTYNALSDFNGKSNTDVWCSHATAQSNWKTASSITNNSGIGYSPAACCAWRYHTIGTSQGDWYIPAAGELGYLIVRFETIRVSVFRVGGGSFNEYSENIGSSSEYSKLQVRYASTSNGYMYNTSKASAMSMLAFVRF